MNDHDVRHADDPCDGRYVMDNIELGVFVEGSSNCVGRTEQKKRMTVGSCIHNRFNAYVAAGPRPVLDDELLTKSLRQPLGHYTRENVGTPTCRETDDQAHRACLICLRPCDV